MLSSARSRVYVGVQYRLVLGGCFAELFRLERFILVFHYTEAYYRESISTPHHTPPNGTITPHLSGLCTSGSLIWRATRDTVAPALSVQLSGCHRSIAQCSRRALIRRRVTTRGDAEVGIHLFGGHSCHVRGLVQNRHLAVAQ